MHKIYERLSRKPVINNIDTAASLRFAMQN